MWIGKRKARSVQRRALVLGFWSYLEQGSEELGSDRTGGGDQELGFGDVAGNAPGYVPVVKLDEQADFFACMMLGRVRILQSFTQGFEPFELRLQYMHRVFRVGAHQAQHVADRACCVGTVFLGRGQIALLPGC